MTKPGFLTVPLLIVLLGFGFSVSSAQTAAPLPTAITHATTLFLGNAGDQENSDCLRAYNDLYGFLSHLGRYKLTEDPNQADLILELHYEISFGNSINTNQGLGGNSIRQFRLVLIDPHSHATLWSLTERTNYALLKKNRDKNLDETISALEQDFSSLASGTPPNNDSNISHD